MRNTLAFLLLAGLVGTANAGLLGYYTGGDDAAINAKTEESLDQTGYAYTAITDSGLAAFDFSSIDVLFTARYDSPLLSTRGADLGAWVNAGGVLVVDDASSLDYFFGAYSRVAAGYSSTDVNVAPTASSTLVNGIHGTIDNTTLDNGSASIHGAVTAASLPVDAIIHLTSTDPNSVVTFSMAYGLGHILYSSIPGYCYLSSCDFGGIEPFTQNYQHIYIPNAIEFGVQLSGADFGGGSVPVPAPAALLGLGLVGLALVRRRRAV